MGDVKFREVYEDEIAEVVHTLKSLHEVEGYHVPRCGACGVQVCLCWLKWEWRTC
jgi:hypothetical protein